jgi:hypothetical protein
MYPALKVALSHTAGMSKTAIYVIILKSFILILWNVSRPSFVADLRLWSRRQRRCPKRGSAGNGRGGTWIQLAFFKAGCQNKIEPVSRRRRRNFWESRQAGGIQICRRRREESLISFYLSLVTSAPTTDRRNMPLRRKLGISFRGGFYIYAAPLALEWVLNAF